MNVKTKSISRFWTFCCLGLFRFFFLSCEIECGNLNRDIKHMPVAYKISKIIVQVLARGYSHATRRATRLAEWNSENSRTRFDSLTWTSWTLLAESRIQLTGLGVRRVRRQWVAQVQLLLALGGARQAHKRTEQDDRADHGQGAGHRSMGHWWQFYRQFQQRTHLRG